MAEAPKFTIDIDDLASDVLDALTRKLRDYDRISAALTSAQAEATRQTERARKAEGERDMHHVSERRTNAAQVSP